MDHRVGGDRSSGAAEDPGNRGPHRKGPEDQPQRDKQGGQGEGDVVDMNVADWGNRCRIPGTDGIRPEDRVNVPVGRQKFARRASEAVYCSCRCQNADGKTDDGARYCDCPNGYACSTRLPASTTGRPFTCARVIAGS